MKAQSDVYIKLQNIYKDKARRDADEVLQTVRQLAPDRDIDPTEVELFCTNARFIKLINSAEGRGPSLAQVVGQPPPSLFVFALSTALPIISSHVYLRCYIACITYPNLHKSNHTLQKGNLAMTKSPPWPARKCH